jgi:hypothetical protein
MIPRNTPPAIQDAPILQYASGHTEARPVGIGRFSGFVGFHVERGKDLAFDWACEQAGVAEVDIRHPRSGGQPEIKRHWSFGESVRFHPITAGPPHRTIAACLRSPATAQAGLGLAWPQGEKSRFAVRGVIVVGGELLVVQLSVRSTMTECLLAALLDHMRVCTVADDMIDRSKHPEVVTLHELALPLVAGQETSVGRGETSQVAPLRSGHPETIDREYIKSCWRKEALHLVALSAWPSILAWAAGYATGETNGDAHLDEAPRALAPGVRPRPRFVKPEGESLL